MKTRTLICRWFGQNGPYTVDFVYIALQFKVADMWIGLYWENNSTLDETNYTIWLCLLPMLPIRIQRVRHLVRL